jgi:pilus assembly protein CpaB
MAGPPSRRTQRQRPRQRGLSRRDLTRALSRHRRTLAVLAAVAAVLSAVTATATPGPPTALVVRATSPVEPGSIIQAGHVRLEAVAEAAVPEDSVRDPVEVVGRRALAGIPVGQVLTRHSTVSGRSVPAGRLLAPVRLADPEVVGLLRPGDRLDVLSADATGIARTLARNVRVVSVPAAAEEARLILIDVDPATAASLAGAAVTGQVSIALRP